jgi:DnaK suppressor protein
MSTAPGIDSKKIQKLLAARREELLTLIDVGEETKTDTELDQQRVGRLSRMDAMQQQAMEDETGRRRDKELHRIASALDRLESDDYGYCTACDEPIAFKRLENDPATPLCISCAQKAS